MAKSLFSNNEPHCCNCCRNGRVSNAGDKILCPHKGVVEADFCCKKYRYDPLKRVPPRPPTLPVFDSEDFKI